MYVRIEIRDLPYELMQNFDPKYPLIVGGLLATELQLGYVRVRVKKHRWYPKILKVGAVPFCEAAPIYFV